MDAGAIVSLGAVIRGRKEKPALVFSAEDFSLEGPVKFVLLLPSTFIIIHEIRYLSRVIFVFGDTLKKREFLHSHNPVMLLSLLLFLVENFTIISRILQLLPDVAR